MPKNVPIRKHGLAVLPAFFIAALTAASQAFAADGLSPYLAKVQPTELFAGADRFGEPIGEPAILPVYKGADIAGYAYLNSDFTNSTGYSGKPIHIVVGIDELLEISGHFHALTDGWFEPAVQPLWALYARHFARPDADPAGPPEDKVREAAALADFEQVRIDSNRIAFSRQGMALTLNGIAQGYVTDRVVQLLRGGGCDQQPRRHGREPRYRCKSRRATLAHRACRP